MSGTTMTAIITDGKISIDIDLVGQNTTGLYWSGSFDTRVRTNSVFNINSTGDRALMDAKLFASQDANKIFSYKNGDLSFQFSMLGMTSTVHLSRSSE
jgi:hypothetical protein